MVLASFLYIFFSWFSQTNKIKEYIYTEKCRRSNAHLLVENITDFLVARAIKKMLALLFLHKDHHISIEKKIV